MYSVDLRDPNGRRKILPSPIKAWIADVHDPLKEIYILLFGLKLLSHDSLFRRSSLGSSRGPKLGAKCRRPLTESWHGNDVAALVYQTARTTWRAPRICGSRLCYYLTDHCTFRGNPGGEKKPSRRRPHTSSQSRNLGRSIRLGGIWVLTMPTAPMSEHHEQTNFLSLYTHDAFLSSST
jgi:hypothetical protein